MKIVKPKGGISGKRTKYSVVKQMFALVNMRNAIVFLRVAWEFASRTLPRVNPKIAQVVRNKGCSSYFILSC